MGESSGVRSFGPFRLDVGAGTLSRDGTVLPLRAKTWSVLCFLVENAGLLVSKEELLGAVWQGSAVTDTIANVSIAELRRALGDDRAAPQYIETVHRRGFRFIAPVERVGAAAPSAPGSATFAFRREPEPSGTILVGRDEELASVTAFVRGETQPARVMLLAGDPGIGKSCLLEAALTRTSATEASRMAIGCGQCPPHFGQGFPFLPVIGALADLCAVRSDAAVVLKERAPSWFERLSVAPAAANGRTTAAPREQPDLDELVAFARDVGPLVFAFEDLHWADHATLDFMGVLAGHPMLQACRVVGTYRPAEATAARHPIIRARRELLRYGHAMEVSLRGLDDRGVAAYVSACFSGARCPPALASELQIRSAGNPLFLSVTVDHLKTAGALEQRDDEVRATTSYAALSQEIPDTLRDLVQQRCDERSEDERRLLGAISVVGLEADAAATAAALRNPLAETDAACDRLSRNSIFLSRKGERTWPDGTISGRYVFRHPLYQRVVYDSLPPAVRTESHRRVAAALVGAFGEHSPAVAAIVADHFDRGQVTAEAIDYHVIAAGDAADRFATKDAIGHLHRALDLNDADADPRREAQILRQLALTLPAVQGVTGADFPALFARSRRLHAEENDVFEGAATLAWLVISNLMQGNAQAAESLAPELEEIATRHATPAMRCLAAVVMGAVLYHQGNVIGTVEQIERDLGDTSIPVPMGPIDLRTALGALATPSLWQAGRPQEARAHAIRAVEIASHDAHPFNLLIALQAEAIVQFWWANHARAREAALQLQEAAAQQGVHDVTGVALMIQGCVECEAGDVDRGVATIDASVEALRAHGGTMTFVLLLGIGAETLVRSDRLDHAAALLDEARQRIAAGEARFFEPEIDRLEGEILRLTGGASAAERAEECFRAAYRNAEQQGSHLLVLRAALSLARLWRADHRGDAADRMVANAVANLRGAEGSPDMRAVDEFMSRATS